MAFALEGKDVLIGGLDITKTLKYRNVLATGNAAFVVVDDLATVDPWQPRGEKVHGEAVIETAGNGRPRIRITPTTVWSWGINKDAEKTFASIEKRTASSNEGPAYSAGIAPSLPAWKSSKAWRISSAVFITKGP